jgi:chromosome segregation ATPase
MDEFDEILAELGEIASSTPAPEEKEVTADEVIDKLEERVTAYEDTTTMPESLLSKPQRDKLAENPSYRYSDEFQDIQDEVKLYIMEYYDIQEQMKDLKEQLKQRKEEAKDIGISVRAVHKALKEVETQIKETPEEAKGIEDVKQFINEHKEIFARIIANAS